MKKAQLSRYEVGNSMPRPEVLHRLAAALGVSHLWLEHGAIYGINDDEVPVEGSKLVPLPDDILEKLFELSTLTGQSISEVLSTALQDAAQRIKEKKSED